MTTKLLTCVYGPQSASRAQWTSSVTVTLGRLVCLLTISCVNTFIALSGQLCWRRCRLQQVTLAGPHVRVRERRRQRKQNALTAVQIQGNPLGLSTSAGSIRIVRNTILAIAPTRASTSVDTKNLDASSGALGALSASCLTPSGTAVDNNHSGPDGVTSHGRWLYAGDGDSTLKVIDLNAPTATIAIKQTISTGGTTRVDEMALTTDGKLLLAANNAEDPPFATLFKANGDASTSNVTINQPRSRSTRRSFRLASACRSSSRPGIPQPSGSTRRSRSSPTTRPDVNYGQPAGAITCHGGMLVTDPIRSHDANCKQGAFDSSHQHRRRPAQCLRTEWFHGRTARQYLCWAAPRAITQATRTTLVINAKTKYYRQHRRHHWL